MNKNNVLVIGSKGQLGTDMVQLAVKNKLICTGLDYPQIDITNRESVAAVLSTVKPEIVINCAAFTAVDDCEIKTSDAYNVNAVGPAILAAATNNSGALLVHISTDYVFDGKKKTPYIETDIPSPQTIYGKSKLEGEIKIAQNTDRFQIYRIAWLYGVFGNNFVKTIRTVATKKSASGESLKVVNDQFGTPTYTLDVCRQIFSTMQKDLFGIFHCTSEGSCSWYDFAREILDSYGIRADLKPCTTEEYPRPAPRPMFSVLENARLKAAGENLMPNWKDAFQAFLNQEKQISNAS
jgi:dTDP-4-dehydrorhamnose reductase